MMRKLLLLLTMTFAVAFTALGQGSTTSSIRGRVVDKSGEALPGSTIVAIHTPTGNEYGSVADVDGYFVLSNMRIGGPYTITVSFVGFQDYAKKDVYLSLGQTFSLDVSMSEETLQLQEVVVSGVKDEVFDGNRTGASTNLSDERIKQLPTINRSINDFTKLTPQSNGTSFAGRDNRFNNYTIDGNVYNNNFGLGSGQFAGGNPISLDAVEEIQVNLAPFDVRAGGFTGASVNAVTRSGTNEFEGSVYYFQRNDQLLGDKLGDTRFSVEDSKTEIQGFRIGGPIIKNKLFFFGSYETEETLVPSFNKVASRPGLPGDGLTVSRVPADRLQFVRDQLNELYGYDAGEFEGYSFASEQERLNIRLDYNISSKHKASVRYNLYTNIVDVPINGNSTRGGVERFRNTSRTGIEAMTFRNANYSQDRRIESIVGELNSILTPNISNQLNIGYTSITDPKRSVPGDQAFPFVEVLEADPSGQDLYYFALGNELFTVGNLLENNVLNITNNVTMFKGKHTYTAGVNFEYMTFDNAFNPVFNGFYRYGSYADFEAAVIDRDPTVQPLAFAQSFAFDGSTTPPTDQTRFAQLGLYVQDEIQVNKKLKVTAGLRLDLPFYPIDLPRNETLDNLDKTFVDINGDEFTPDVSTLPGVKPLFSPRVGFNLDVNGDKITQLRGGTGIFSGRIPFVWISNQVNGNGVIRGTEGLERSRTLNPGDVGYVNDFDANPRPFNPDVNAYRPDGSTASAQLSSQLNLTDENFRLPQVWRTNIAVDRKLPWGITGTAEFIYNVDLNTPIAFNAILDEPDGTLSGPDQRPYWDGGYESDPDLRDVFLLSNAKTNGNYYSFTLSANKQFDNGIYASLAWARSRARDYGLEGSSQAAGLWAPTVSENRNDPALGFTRFDQPNRIIGLFSYNTKNTTISFLYEGGENGRFSYTYSGNFGDNGQRLMYIPNNASELNFVDFTLNGETVTAAQQAAALDAYIDQDDYLSENRGSVAERNGAKRPWLNRIDFRLTEDIVIAKKHKLQLSLDILNVGNLLNPDWGVPQFEIQDNILNYRGRNANNEPTYTFAVDNAQGELLKDTFQNSTSIGDAWSAQIGIRYLFNN